MRIFATSDTHFGHDREFLYKPRGFNSIAEHDEEVIRRWNETVEPDDWVLHLGDVMLGDNKHGLECLKKLNGKIFIVPGNHDTATRIKLYKELPNVKILEPVETEFAPLQSAAFQFKYKKYSFYVSHQPTMTSNLEKAPYLKMHLINLFGHTHQQKRFYNDIPFMFHVGMDSNDCRPVLLDDAIQIMKEETSKCLALLDEGEVVDIDKDITLPKEETKCPTQPDTWTTIVQRVKKLFSKT